MHATRLGLFYFFTGASSPGVPGVPGVPWHPHILADQLTLSQRRGADYAHQIIQAPPDFQTFLRPCFISSVKQIWRKKKKRKETKTIGLASALETCFE